MNQYINENGWIPYSYLEHVYMSDLTMEVERKIPIVFEGISFLRENLKLIVIAFLLITIQSELKSSFSHRLCYMHT